MKIISHRQSRRNSARRRRKVKARHARAGRWRPRVRPMFGVGKVSYEIGARISAMSFGGIGAVRRLVAKLGLAWELDGRLKLLKLHLPYHESDHVLNVAYNMLCGGTRLEDLGALRNNVAYMDALGAALIPSPSAAGDFTRRFEAADVGRADGGHQRGATAVVGGPGAGPAGAGGVPRCVRDAGAHAGREEGGHGHGLQGGVGLPPAGHLADQHGRGALSRQPAGQRGEPPGRGGVDRPGHRPRGPVCRSGVRARGRGLLADRPLRPLERGGGLHLRL